MMDRQTMALQGKKKIMVAKPSLPATTSIMSDPRPLHRDTGDSPSE